MLLQALETSKEEVILDLCSGGGGPAFSLQQVLRERSLPYRVCLSDKYPNTAVWNRLIRKSDGRIFAQTDPVDCLANGAALQAFRTLFTSAHHFAPAQASQVIAQSIRDENGIGIFEVTERNVLACIRILPIFLLTFLVVPFLRPFSLTHIFWTYVIPLVPISILWDGVVSNLRTYTPEELHTLAEAADAARGPGSIAITWSSGVIDSIFGTRVTYLIGTPVRN